MYTLIMASLQRYTVRGKSYYRIVESKRINGKPRAIPVLHLGTADALLLRLRESSSQEIAVKSFEYGAIAALLEVAHELDLVSIINGFLPKKIRGVSAGEALLLMAINRVIDPCSKSSWSDWAKKTALFRFFPHIPIAKLSSQFFWEHMQKVPDTLLQKIEGSLVQAVIEKYQLTLDLLFFDTTNCYSYVSDRKDEEWLFQYGHSKERQYHRRIFGVELLVTRESTIPLYHRTYSGNQHDSKLFPGAVATLCARLEALQLPPSSVTLVFDRGNVSKDNFNKLDKSELGFVTGLRLGDIPRELFDIPLQRFKRTKKGRHVGIRFFSETVTLWGEKRLAVFYLSEKARDHQVKILNDQIERKIAELTAWNASIMNQAARSEEALSGHIVLKKIKSLQLGPYLKEILSISYDPALPREKRLQFSINEKAKADIILKYFGKRCLVTNRLQWHASEVIDAYFEQATVERAFQLTKNHHHIAIRPQFHRTNQSTRVHVFSCFIALLLGQVLLRKARAHDSLYASVPVLIETLSSIRIAALLSKNASSIANPGVIWKLEKSDTKTLALLSKLSSLPL